VLDRRQRIFIPISWLVPADKIIIWVDGLIDVRNRDTTAVNIAGVTPATHFVCRWLHVHAEDDPERRSRIFPLRVERVHPSRQCNPRTLPQTPLDCRHLPQIVVAANFFQDNFAAMRSHLCSLCHRTMRIMNISVDIREHMSRMRTLAVLPTDVCGFAVNARMLPMLQDLEHGMRMDLPTGPAFVRVYVFANEAVRIVSDAMHHFLNIFHDFECEFFHRLH
jgi:hypothetical protein